LGAVAAPCDLTDRAALNALLADHSDVDILIANAGVPATGTLDTYDEAEVDRVVEANLTAPIQMTRALLPGMIARGRGHIVLVSSLSGKVASPGSSMYSATKFGLRGFGLALRQDLGGTGVGSSVLTLGFIRDAGMFSKSGGPEVLPPGVGTSSPEEVAAATVTAITKNRAEITVAPVPMKVGAVFGSALPRIAAVTQKASGGHAIAERMGDAQRSWRS
ncbi:MAG: SDR family NAD(P)-dependent oxidoreductase, partial [Solirubrobacteraceae bacterium]|nr:SDR family NAD(P)-dependent oxidoreductase [Patulibacter sp.]